MVKTPQRQRHNTGGGTGGAELPLLGPGVIEAHHAVEISTMTCCVPLSSGCQRPGELLDDDPDNVIRVVCSSDNCPLDGRMHAACFEAWERTVLRAVRGIGRARSWSEKQRAQNLWTPRGYDLAYRACACSCGRGHLRKAFDWSPASSDSSDAGNRNIRKKKVRQTQPPTSTSSPGRPRTNSVSSSSSGSSDPSGPFTPPHKTIINNNKNANMFSHYKYKTRHGSGGSLFARRLDFSAFNSLPKNKLNSYHIKMEDDGYHGNDETRSFILSTLAGHKASHAACVLCHKSLAVFDRYPLIDGTFFLTPIQHHKNTIPVEIDGRHQYLSAACMACLEGWNVMLKCSYCNKHWDGSSLILGTMYSFDIFAAMPCCKERLQCTRCQSLVTLSEERQPSYSEFSRPLACPTCDYVDLHFVKAVSSRYYVMERNLLYQLANFNLN